MWRTLSALLTFAVLAAAATILLITPNLRPRTESAEAITPPAVESKIAATPAPAAPPIAASPTPANVTAIVDRSGAPLQCAIYARQRTGISLTGAARNWWPQAEGRYRRSATPSAGAVIVIDGTSAGHVAVVTRVINGRQIVIDHANWLGGGEIITGALVEDASANNDWSQVRVWNVQTNSMGMREYPVFGFVGPDTV